MEKWFYSGPVYQHGRMVADRWKGETTAVSPEKALNNLAYQCKRAIGYGGGACVKLDSKYLYLR